MGAAKDLPPFAERFPWRGGDLQTVRNYLVRDIADLSRWPEERIEIEAPDGSGDRLLAKLHSPDSGTALPLVILQHGLTGCEGSYYILETARWLLELGFPVLRLNLRGAGPGRKIAGGHYCAGSSEDLAAVLYGLGKVQMPHGVAVVGYSLGANILLKYLGEAGDRGPVRCAVSVSAPIDLRETAFRMMAPRNRVYHHWLLARMKEEALAGDLSDPERAAIGNAESVYRYDDVFIAPRFGFDGAEDYYSHCAASGFLDRIEVPTLLVHARNDPWIPPTAYDAVSGKLPSNLTMLVPEGGGHVGFHGRDRRTPWHNICIGAFIARHS